MQSEVVGHLIMHESFLLIVSGEPFYSCIKPASTMIYTKNLQNHEKDKKKSIIEMFHMNFLWNLRLKVYTCSSCAQDPVWVPLPATQIISI